MSPIIDIEGVDKFYDDFQVLSEVSLTVDPGEVVVVLGPSGSGKSSLIRCVNGLEPIAAGRIVVDGVTVHDRRTDLNRLRTEIGFVFQQFNLYPHLTVERNVMLAPMKVRGMAKDEAHELALELLDRVGIREQAGKHPAQLSGGQQQRAAIARALAMKPRIMLFDEPTSALDAEMIREVLDVMTDLANTGMTMMVVTHELAFARKVADHVIFMEAGTIVEKTAPATFFADPQDARSKRFLSQIIT
ncbi:amino acid ABC transporter ATP-binding protein [Prauserella cavernicola]|uniref:ABC-type polar-amino-acid transporter n=1 Tax=Prauserella cavernicola TaxID=2800127 RepID=A0A934V6W0_9PSEU|nr:amino acid ABC transporter ATP-binding protein [Prauserella cavernicola]MBK1786625.1 amino acid ABC transporter ATP-binding protein [Prauserella cavernicola]